MYIYIYVRCRGAGHATVDRSEACYDKSADIRSMKNAPEINKTQLVC